MTIARATVTNRAAAVRAALLKADTNRDGRLSAAEQRRAVALTKGAGDAAVTESFKQARLRGGAVSVSRARSLVSLAQSRALAADRNRNGVSAAERNTLTGPIARALTRGASGGAAEKAKPTGNLGTFGPKASRLAKAAERQARLMNSRGWCARGVNRALAAAGLYVTPLPSAYLYAKKLAADPRFREIKVTDAQIRKLPPGAIVVSAPYNSPGNPHGHISVTLGRGLEASDHIRRVATNGTQRVFVPRG